MPPPPFKAVRFVMITVNLLKIIFSSCDGSYREVGRVQVLKMFKRLLLKPSAGINVKNIDFLYF